ncbi:hypothetical protein D3C85_1586830 [compost metagenome]
MEEEQFTIRGLAVMLSEDAFTDLMVLPELRPGIIRQREDTGVLQVFRAGMVVELLRVLTIRGREIMPEPIKDIMRMRNGDIQLLQMVINGCRPDMLPRDAEQQLVMKLPVEIKV